MSAAIDHVLFDLDGTLVDTAQDLADALNQTLLAHGRPALSFASIRPLVSLGANTMISFAFKTGTDDKNFAAIREQFLHTYHEQIAEKSRLFEGMDIVLRQLVQNNIPWGIVTNKPGWLTAPLAEALALDRMTNCIVSGDTVAHSKPHPAPMFYACKILHRRPEQGLYVGDARRDIEAGKNAGMLTLAATYGYIPVAEAPQSWDADGLIDKPVDILGWLPRLGS